MVKIANLDTNSHPAVKLDWKTPAKVFESYKFNFMTILREAVILCCYSTYFLFVRLLSSDKVLKVKLELYAVIQKTLY